MRTLISVSDIVSSCITLTLKVRPRTCKISAKRADINFEYTSFQKKLSDLSRQLDEDEKELAKWEKIFFSSSIILKKQDVILIKKKLDFLTNAAIRLMQAQRIYKQLAENFKKDPTASKLVLESRKHLARAERIKERAQKDINKLATKLNPEELSDEILVVK